MSTYIVVNILCASRSFKDQMHSGDPSEKVSVCYKVLMLDKEQNPCSLHGVRYLAYSLSQISNFNAEKIFLVGDFNLPVFDWINQLSLSSDQLYLNSSEIFNNTFLATICSGDQLEWHIKLNCLLYFNNNSHFFLYSLEVSRRASSKKSCIFDRCWWNIWQTPWKRRSVPCSLMKFCCSSRGTLIWSDVWLY